MSEVERRRAVVKDGGKRKPGRMRTQLRKLARKGGNQGQREIRGGKMWEKIREREQRAWRNETKFEKKD